MVVSRRKVGHRVVIETEQVLLARIALEDAIDAGAMACIHGRAGLGKTFATEHALASCRAAFSWLSFPNHPTPRQIADGLLRELTGKTIGGSRFRITEPLLDELGVGNRVVVIDEAQHLNRDCIEYLRHLHDHDRAHFALVLVGGDGCWEVLSREPMLRSRIYRRVRFRRMGEGELLQIIPRFHPIYADAEPELLLFIDEHCGHGEFRNWASFTELFRKSDDRSAETGVNFHTRGPHDRPRRLAHDNRCYVDL